MIEPSNLLSPSERVALDRLLGRLLAAGEPPLLRAILFGSKARGDADVDSDLDLLLICDLDPDNREEASRILARDALIINLEHGSRIETWTVAADDLNEGCRTPMLVDALEDGVTLWPRDATRLYIPFTPADAHFCTRRLLDWVEAGGPIVRRALHEGRWSEAAQRCRDDITRLAAATLLLYGETRHRRASSLSRFAERFIVSGHFPPTLYAPLAWAANAFPPNGGRGIGRPPPTPQAIATAPAGLHHASLMATTLVPYLHTHLPPL